MKYKIRNVEKIKYETDSENIIKRSRKKAKDFTRKRKVMPRDIILYELNKRGLSSKMEIINFNNINEVQDITAPGLYKQREKLNPEVFVYLTHVSLKEFYYNSKDEVKTYKGYVLTAIDGSDFEIPNTPQAREKFNGKLQEQCARATVSTYFDILNKYTLDTIVETYNYSETEMAYRHLTTIKQEKVLDDYKSILMADRNYRNLSYFYQAIKNDEKFVIRIANSVYEKETKAMKNNDEIIEIGYEYNRAKYYKEKDPELYEYLKSGNTIKIRCVKIKLSTGEIEYLLTNLEMNAFSTEEMKGLYNLRWKIEINYKHLKNNIKIECITSSKEDLIKQDIYSQVLVANMLQAFINDGDKEIQSLRYKNKMKVNNNMAIGIFKNTLIYILLEEEASKRSKMMDKFQKAIEKHMVPVKPNRVNERKK